MAQEGRRARRRKPLAFERRGDVFLGAFPWRFRSLAEALTAYADSYRDAAEALFGTGDSVSHLLFPLTFLWRHHIELLLKEMIASGRAIAGDPWGFPDNEHRLQPLWAEAKALILQHLAYYRDDDFAECDAQIAELETVDPRSMTFRYSQDRSGQLSVPEPQQMKPAQIHQAMVRLASALQGKGCAVANVLDEQERRRGT